MMKTTIFKDKFRVFSLWFVCRNRGDQHLHFMLQLHQKASSILNLKQPTLRLVKRWRTFSSQNFKRNVPADAANNHMESDFRVFNRDCHVHQLRISYCIFAKISSILSLKRQILRWYQGKRRCTTGLWTKRNHWFTKSPCGLQEYDVKMVLSACQVLENAAQKQNQSYRV